MRISDYFAHITRKDEDVPLSFKLVTAGMSACFADFATFPLDTIKVRMQISGEKRVWVTKTTRHIIKSQGIWSLYGGLHAGLQRQTCYAAVRLALYETVRTLHSEVYGKEDGSHSLTLGIRAMAGITTGVLAVLIFQPTDVVKVRFQAGYMGQSSVRYHSTLDAYKVIVANEGILGLWRGTFPNMCRNAILNVSEIVFYEKIKGFFINSKILNDGGTCHFASGVTASLCATIVTSPVDVVKTRFMKSHPGEYKNSIEVAGEMLCNEGFSAFYKGFFPSVTRLVFWHVILWVTYDQLQVLGRKYFKK